MKPDHVHGADATTPGVSLSPGASPEAPTHTRPEAKLELRDITYSYGDTLAVDRVSLSVGEGEFVSILGPSGCGKTTLLRILAGLSRPMSGTVVLDNRDITKLPPEKRALGMVFQDLALFPHLSVLDNVTFSLSVAGVTRTEQIERASRSLHMVGLAGYENRAIGQLSGGQRQRVALARSLVSEPEVLLLDEPLGALDAGIRRDMQLELKELQRRLNITFVFVTHDQDEAMSMSDRIVLMDRGRVVQDAHPRDAYRRPVTAFAAQFLGETNLIEATVVAEGEGQARVELVDGTVLDVPVDRRRSLQPGAPTVLGIRPEYLRASRVGNAGSLTSGTVVAHSYHGSHVMLNVDTPLGPLRLRDVDSTDLEDVSLGETVHIDVDLSQAQIFVGE